MGDDDHGITSGEQRSGSLFERKIRSDILIDEFMAGGNLRKFVEYLPFVRSSDDGIFIVVLEIAAIDNPSIPFLVSRKYVVEYLGERHDSFSYPLFESIEDVGLLDNIRIHHPRSDAGPYDSGESSGISEFS